MIPISCRITIAVTALLPSGIGGNSGPDAAASIAARSGLIAASGTRCSSSFASLHSTRMPRADASRAAAVSIAVLPMPDSPSTRTIPPAPATTPSIRFTIRSSSSRRPIKRPSGPPNGRYSSGSPAPDFSTSAAVGSISLSSCIVPAAWEAEWTSDVARPRSVAPLRWPDSPSSQVEFATRQIQ